MTPSVVDPSSSARPHLAWVPTTIRSQATAVACDLIVVGTHARWGLALLLGSTTDGVMHGAECDVLAVKVDTVT